jgi:N-acetylated-alpha-linked acidic dipeptidase
MKWNIEAYLKQIDIDYSYALAKRMEKFRTNAELGYRTAGSAAEIAAGKMICAEMKKIGLKKVRRDRIKVDSWEFRKAELRYTDKTGKVKKCILGGYQTDFHTDGFREYGLVYAGRGTAAEYEDLDVKGKLVIVDMNQRNEWWINYPVYEAYLHGAAALLAVQQYGYGEFDDRSLNAQDIAGPAYAPAFSLSKKDASRLKKRLRKDPEMKVRFSAESKVIPDAESFNVIGEIPGEDKDHYILLSAHYDSYFSGFQDDNAAIGMLLGMARAFVKSGLKPHHTLLFAALCAEEWGVSDSKYDWSTGAFEEAFTVHPEWQGKVIADMNFELPAHAHGKKDAIRSNYEYAEFLREFTGKIKVPQKAYPGGIKVKSPLQTMSDDFSFSIAGIPAMVNDFTSGNFMETQYHSQFDNADDYQKPVYRFHHELYGRLLLEFDRVLIPPLDFTQLLNELLSSVDERLSALAGADIDTFRNTLYRVREEAGTLREKIRIVNRVYAAFLEAGDREHARTMRETYSPCIKAVLDAYLKAQKAFVRLGWDDSVVFPHEGVRDNIIQIEKAVHELKDGNVLKALEKIYRIDNNRYAFLFSEEVFTHFTDVTIRQPKERLKWGYGRILRHTNLYRSVRGLKKKALVQVGSGKKYGGSLKEEIKYYRKLKTEELQYLKDDIEYMSKALLQIESLFGRASGYID